MRVRSSALYLTSLVVEFIMGSACPLIVARRALGEASIADARHSRQGAAVLAFPTRLVADYSSTCELDSLVSVTGVSQLGRMVRALEGTTLAVWSGR